MLDLRGKASRYRDKLRITHGRFIDWLADGFELSIGWHQSIAIFAVAALALTANFIIEHGASMIKTTSTISTPVTQFHAIKNAGVAPPQPVVESASLPDAKALKDAIDVFATALRSRIQINSAQTDEQLRSAKLDMKETAAAFAAKSRAQHSDSLNKLSVATRQYSAAGDALIQLADQRRQVLAEYSIHFEAMNGRMKQSVDAAWKIFGRVVARQSLIQLSNQLDDIRRHWMSFSGMSVDDTAALAALALSNQTFAQTLADNERSFIRSEGKQWVEAMKVDYAQISAMPELLADSNARWRDRAQQLNKLESRVKELAQAHADLFVADQRELDSVRSASAPLAARRPDDAPIAASVAPAEQVTTTTQTTANAAQSQTIAWLSTAILVLLLLVSLITIRSIAKPVHSLLQAMAKVTAGQGLPPLPRGSIKELNDLVNAFATMSHELSTARLAMQASQEQLEHKVDERTRELKLLAEHDPLTLLPNRRHLFSLLDAAMASAARQQRVLGVFFIDVDNFKNINDSMGHAFGDIILKKIAERLSEAVRDYGFAARLGGDEFTFVLTDLADQAQAIELGSKIMASFHQPVHIDHRELMVSVSMGASLYPQHEQTSEALLRAADAALFQAKALGRSQLSFFTPDLLQAAANRFSIEQGLRQALEKGEFELVFQPEINAETLEVDLVEALIRWRLPDGTLLAPGDFLSVAEESGLIMEISDWVLRAAITTAADWHHGAWPKARVAINVSPRQLMDSRFVQNVMDLLTEFHLPAQCIEIELTENALQTGAATLDTLKKLRAAGIALALDDFGTGYSSLASLEQLPFTRVKLDRSLISSIDTNPRTNAITRAIVGLCHGLGLEMTAEGIERPEQFAMLSAYRAMHLQGYLLARPLAAEAVPASLTQVREAAMLLVLTNPEAKAESNVVDMATALSRRTGESNRA